MKQAQPSAYTLSREEARHLMLAAQGLDHAAARPATNDDVLAAIRRMGVLQIDTIHVIARSPYLVLWSRLGDYDCRWLDQLLEDRALFEYWSHAMCFLPIEDYPLYRRRMIDAAVREEPPWRGALKWAREHPEVIDRVIAHLRENGAVRSAEIEGGPRPPGGWWNWKDEKIALEVLLLTGEVMVLARRNFQRIYALRERVAPGWDDAQVLSAEDVRRTLALRAVRSLGVAHAGWVADYYRQRRTGMPQLLEELAANGQLMRAEIEGLPGPAYLHPDRVPELERVASGQATPTLTTLLSPFDPLVWDRQRARELFDFDYTIEVYTPAAKRRYGYFTLPILHRGRLVGRLDPKVHRSTGLFEIKAVHLESGVPVDDQLVADLAAALRRLANWHGAPDLVVRQSDPPALAPLLQVAA